MLGSFVFWMVIFVKLSMFMYLTYCFFILPREAVSFKKNNHPIDSLTIDEYRLLKKYYPKEKFNRGVWMLEGLHRTAPTLSDWEGTELIDDVPVFFHSSAENFLNRNGDNKAKVAMGKKRAYIVELNYKYSIVDSSAKVELHERFWNQWGLGLPGSIEGYPDAELLDQRESDKREKFYSAYRYAPDFFSGDFIRFTGSFFSFASLVFFWLIYFDLFYVSYLYQCVFIFLGVIGSVLVFLPAFFMSGSEEINVIKGKCEGVSDEGFKVGGLSVKFDENAKPISPEDLTAEAIVVDVWVNSNVIVKINEESCIRDDMLRGSREPVKAPAIMMVLFFISTIALFDLNGNVFNFQSLVFSYNISMTAVFFLIFLFKLRFHPFSWSSYSKD